MKKPRWDPAKAEANWQKHRVRFEEAVTVFDDFNAFFTTDLAHSMVEDRYKVIGESASLEILTVIYAIRDDDSWIISARAATRKERRWYVIKPDELHDRPLEEDNDEGINFDDIPPTDFTRERFVRGLHRLSRKVVKTVGIYEDVAEFFADEKAVNRALREVIAVGNAPSQRGY